MIRTNPYMIRPGDVGELNANALGLIEQVLRTDMERIVPIEMILYIQTTDRVTRIRYFLKQLVGVHAPCFQIGKEARGEVGG